MDRGIDFHRMLKTKMNKTTLTAEKILADALPHGIVVLDAKGHIDWFNQEASQLLALTEDSSPIIAEIFKDESFLTFLSTGGMDTFELYAPHNKNIRLSIYLRPYLHDQSVLIIQDITHRYRLENMREAFIANVSHELRTPLTVFRGYLEMLLEQPELPTAKLQEILKQMATQDYRMERLVKDLLLLSRLESVVPDVEKHQKVFVASLIRQIYQDALSLGKKQNHQFELELDDDLWMMGEPHELRSAFSNIIVNAVRYTPKNGKIKIKWYKDSKGIHFEVTDSGIGIEDKHIDRITQRFYRVDKARSREQGGTGLGLAIVKHVLLRHGGDLVIKSQPDVGSTFICTFPL